MAIENAYYADGFYDNNGQLKGHFSASDFGLTAGTDYLLDSVQIGTENLAGAKVALNLDNSSIVTETLDPGPPAETMDHEATQLHSDEAVLVLNAGRVIDEASDAIIRIRLQSVDVNGLGSSIAYTYTVYDASTPSSRAPMRLQDPDPPNAYFALSLTSSFSDRYFLKGQRLYLDLPWWANFATTPDPIEYPITENQSTLRFDGLSWHY